MQVRDAGRRLVWIAADGKTVDPIADGRLLPSRLFAGPAPAGRHRRRRPGRRRRRGQPLRDGPARHRGTRVRTRARRRPAGRPALVGAERPIGARSRRRPRRRLRRAAQLCAATAPIRRSGRRRRRSTARPASSRRCGSATTASPSCSPTAPGGPTHLRLLARRPNGSFKRVKDFPALTGSELAATGHYLALQRGNGATGGAIDLLDADRAHPWLRRLTTGANPAWAG